jgi:hypothetical protein
MVNPLEPLLLQLARDFTDNRDLSDRLHKIWTVRRLWSVCAWLRMRECVLCYLYEHIDT